MFCTNTHTGTLHHISLLWPRKSRNVTNICRYMSVHLFHQWRAKFYSEVQRKPRQWKFHNLQNVFRHFTSKNIILLKCCLKYGSWMSFYGMSVFSDYFIISNLSINFKQKIVWKRHVRVHSNLCHNFVSHAIR